MKKIMFSILCLISFITNVNAADFVWHNSADFAYTTEYSGTILGTESGNYQNGTIVSNGNYNIALNNFKAYDIMIYEAYTLSLNGTNIVDYIEQSSDSAITLTGNGILKVKEIGLSMADMIGPKTPNYQSRIKAYVKGDYDLNVQGDYLVFTTKQINSANPNTSQNTTTSEEDLTSSEQKDLLFKNSKYNITVKGNSQIDDDITLTVDDVTKNFTEDIKEYTNETVYKIYDLNFTKNNKVMILDKEVTVTIKVEPGKSYNVYYYSDNGFLKLASSLSNDQLSFETNHFSKYVITLDDNNQSSEAKIENNDNEDQQSNQKTYIIIGAGALIILVAGYSLSKKKK